MGSLYLVATPIGNLEDITLRALKVLQDAVLIAAEDTRTARKLLTHYQIKTPVTSYFEHNELRKLDGILGALEKGNVAVISEAGMPGISDPGYQLVRAAIERGIRVVPIPGASALTTALAAAGLAADQFVFLGFLPRQGAARRRLLKSVKDEKRTLVAFEAPHRVRASLEDIERVLGDRAMCISRELTKVYEEFFRGQVSRARAHFSAQAPRGEFVFVVEGTKERERVKGREKWTEARLRAQIKRLMDAGVSRTEAVKRVARQAGRPRHEVYEQSLSLNE